MSIMPLGAKGSGSKSSVLLAAGASAALIAAGAFSLGRLWGRSSVSAAKSEGAPSSAPSAVAVDTAKNSADAVSVAAAAKADPAAESKPAAVLNPPQAPTLPRWVMGREVDSDDDGEDGEDGESGDDDRDDEEEADEKGAGERAQPSESKKKQALTPAEKFAKKRESLHRYKDVKGPMKMMLCVRTDLKMKPGKQCAQCCHATMGVLRQILKYEVPIDQWLRHGQAKIAVKISGEEQLLELENKARAAGLPYHTVCDAGRTQVAPDSLTVLAIGPGPESVIKGITGELSLL